MEMLLSNGSRNLANSFEKLCQIGQGTYGQVFKAKDIKTGETVALKKILTEKEKEGFPITAIREINILNKLNHPNIVKLKEIVTAPRDRIGDVDIYMVFEYMDHDLAGLTSDRRFEIPQIKLYMKQLLTGVHFCHANHVLHRDIKASNILLDNKGNVKVADFGLARMFSKDPNGKLTNCVVTLWYRPPELLLGSTKYGPAIDMWSVGCIFGELLCGKPILPGKTEPEQIGMIFDLCGSPDEGNWPGCSKLPLYDNFKPLKPKVRRIREMLGSYDPDALELLERMLTLDPSKRITAKDALLSNFFWNGTLPADPRSLPEYEASHEFQTNQTRQKRLKENEELAKRQKLQHSQPAGRSQLQYESNHPNHHNFEPRSAPGPSYHHGGTSRHPTGGEYNYSRGFPGGSQGPIRHQTSGEYNCSSGSQGPSRHTTSRKYNCSSGSQSPSRHPTSREYNCSSGLQGPSRRPISGEYNCNSGLQGGRYRSSPYISQRQGPPSHAKSGALGSSLRSGGGDDGGRGGPNSNHEGGYYRGSNEGRIRSANRNQSYDSGWK